VDPPFYTKAITCVDKLNGKNGILQNKNKKNERKKKSTQIEIPVNNQHVGKYCIITKYELFL
jgi:hypothetical protein